MTIAVIDEQDREADCVTSSCSARRGDQGRVALGPYELIRLISSGGFGRVFEALDTRCMTLVALKIPIHSDSESRARCTREVEMTSRFCHANVMPIRRAELIEDSFVIALPLGQEDLERRICRPLAFERALEYASQLLAGLAHVHARGVIHCDVNPSNVVIFPDGHLRLSDFGIARDGWSASLDTASGTAEYMAPEHAAGRVSTRSDVFSAGLVLHELLIGRLPEPHELVDGGAELSARAPSLPRRREQRSTKRGRGESPRPGAYLAGRGASVNPPLPA